MISYRVLVVVMQVDDELEPSEMESAGITVAEFETEEEAQKFSESLRRIGYILGARNDITEAAP